MAKIASYSSQWKYFGVVAERFNTRKEGENYRCINSQLK